MSIRSLADFNRSSLGGDGDWLTPPPSPPRPCKPGRHGERGMGTFNWPPARTSTWPYTGTFSWPRTRTAGYLMRSFRAAQLSSSVSSLKERGRVKRGFTGLCPWFGRSRACRTGPRACCSAWGRGLPCSPAAAGPGERPGRVKDRAQPGRRGPAPSGVFEYARHGRSIGGESPLEEEVVLTPSRRQLRRCEAGWEGSPRRIPAPGNTNRV